MRILVLSDSHGCVEPMEQCVERVQPQVILHLGDCVRDAQRLEERYPDIPLLGVPGNCDYGGLDQPERLTELGGVRILMMHGHPGQTAEVKRTEGAMDILAQNPDMTQLDEQTADWDRAEAMTLMETWIQAYGDQINAVFCQNDEMALGALNALVQAGKKDNVLVVGVDAIDDALQSVKDGKMDATVYQDCKGQAEGAIEAAYKLAKGESVEKEILIPFILVTTENVDEYLK